MVFWALVIGIVILLLAVLIQQWVFVVAEEDSHFIGAVGGFLVLFIISAFALSWMMPDLTAKSDVGGLVNAWVGGPSQASAAELPLYGE